MVSPASAPQCLDRLLLSPAFRDARTKLQKGHASVEAEPLAAVVVFGKCAERLLPVAV